MLIVCSFPIASEFWDKGYTLTIDDNTEDVLLFPTDLLRGIFRCGKALNLLKACAQDVSLSHVSCIGGCVTLSLPDFPPVMFNCMLCIFT